MADRFAKTGDKVRFLDRNGSEEDLETARKVFAKNQILTVRDRHHGIYHPTYLFEGYGNWYNARMFEVVPKDARPEHFEDLSPLDRERIELLTKVDDLTGQLNEAVALAWRKGAKEWVREYHPEIAKKLERPYNPGLYLIHWTDGGSSQAAIGITENGKNWIAPTNWVNGCWVGEDIWDQIARIEPIKAPAPV